MIDIDNDLRLDRLIHFLQDQVKEAQKELYKGMVAKFITGARISWLYRDVYEQFGTVVRVSEAWWSTPELVAVNERTGKRVTVYLWMLPMVVK